jgi:hypothetical protein
MWRETCWFSKRRFGLNVDLGLCVHWRQNWLAVHHACTFKNIEGKPVLGEEEPIPLMLYGDPQNVMEGSEVLHGEFPLEDRYGLLQKCCARCGEDNVINVKKQLYRIYAELEDE